MVSRYLRRGNYNQSEFAVWFMNLIVIEDGLLYQFAAEERVSGFTLPGSPE